MLFKTKFLPKDVYSEEGFFDPIKNVFNSIKDKFNKDIVFHTKVAVIEKDLSKTYLDDTWLDRRKWVNPNTKLVVHNGNYLLSPEIKENIIANATVSIQETNDFLKFLQSEFRFEEEFARWVDNSGWRKNLRQIYQFSRTLKSSYGPQDIPKFHSKTKEIEGKTETVPPVLDYGQFKLQTQEMLNLHKVLVPSILAIENNFFAGSIFYEWNKSLYDYIKDQVREDFTEETEYHDQEQNRTIITQRLVHEEEYVMVLDCLRRLNECILAAREQMNAQNGNLKRPAYNNTVRLREALYRQLRGSFTA